MTTERDIAARFQATVSRGQFAEWRLMYSGRRTTTGITLDGAATGKCWVRAEETSREETQVWGYAARVNLPVYVGPNIAGELEIKTVDQHAAAFTAGDGAAAAILPPITPDNNANLLIGGRQFLPGRMRLSALGGLYVYVEPFHYDGGYWPGGDFLMTVPSTSSKQAWCALAMNPADDTLYQFTGTEYALPYLLTEVELGNLIVTPGYIPVGAVVLYNGQTTITGAERWADFHYHFAQAGSAISGFVTLTPDSDTRNTVQPSGDHPALIIKNNASQTDNPFQAQTSAGDVNVAITPLGGLTVNEQGADADTRIEGDTDANLVFVDASTDRVGIGTASPAQLLDVDGTAIIQTLMTDASTELTIATGAITVTQTFHRVDTEADAASDDLATINGGADGQFLVIRAENAGREVVVTTAGNITTSDGNNVALDEVYKFLLLIYDGNRSKWNVVGGGGGGGSGSYYQTVQDEGTPAAQRSALNFTGAGVSVSDDSGNDRTNIVISGGGTASGITIKEADGSPLVADVATIVVANGTLTDDGGGQVTITTGGGAGSSPYSLCQGRLTLTSGTAVTTSDVTAATTLYFTPYKGNQIGLYNGSSWEMKTFSEISLSLSGYTASKPYDIWVYNNAGTVTLDSTVWTNDTTRATALTTQDGVYVKTGATTRRYVGTIRITATTGQCEDSLTKRFVWNYYNRTTRVFQERNPTSGYTYSTATWRQAGANSAAQVDLVVGVAESRIHLNLIAGFTLSGTYQSPSIGFGEDSTSTVLTEGVYEQAPFPANVPASLIALLDKVPSAGFHYYAHLERGWGSGTQSWAVTEYPYRLYGITGYIEG